jgi:acetolactate synthase-1/2/3 large subunit
MAEAELMTGAEMVLRALAEHGVKHVFGYPGGAVLPIYDEFFQQDKVKHILVRHEQGATHMVAWRWPPPAPVPPIV